MKFMTSLCCGDVFSVTSHSIMNFGCGFPVELNTITSIIIPLMLHCPHYTCGTASGITPLL